MQSLDPVVQKAINRVQSYEQTADAVGWLRAAGIAGINLDLIYGLPHQTVASSVETVTECLALRPDRIAVFGYAHVPSFKKHQRKIDATAAARRRGAQHPGRGDRRRSPPPAIARSASTTSPAPTTAFRSPKARAGSTATSRATPPIRQIY